MVVGARRLCGCLTAVWGARLVAEWGRIGALGCLLLCLLDGRAGA